MAVGLTVWGLVAGCGGEPLAPISPEPALPASATATATATGDPAGAQACELVEQAVQEATLMDPGVVDGILAAEAAAEPAVSAAARALRAAHVAALAARGGATEPDAVAAVSSAGVDMAAVCRQSGLRPAG